MHIYEILVGYYSKKSSATVIYTNKLQCINNFSRRTQWANLIY